MSAAGQGVKVGVARERAPGERRVALSPETCKKLVAAGAEVRIEAGAGTGAGMTDEAYRQVGGHVVADAATALNDAHVVVCVQAPPAAGLAG